MSSKLVPLIVRSTDERIPRVFLSDWTKRVASHLGRESLSVRARRALESAHEVSLVFVSVQEIQRLNREFRGKDKPTDVLSFAPTDEGSLGELVFSLQIIRAQATEHALSYQDELGYMVLHGVLHLLGYDHETSRTEEQRMFKLQDRVFDNLRGKK